MKSRRQKDTHREREREAEVIRLSEEKTSRFIRIKRF